MENTRENTENINVATTTEQTAADQPKVAKKRMEKERRADADRMRTRKSLERYLEGWTVRETLTPEGNIRRERIYIDDYYYTSETKKQRILRKVLYVLLFVVSVALFGISAVQPVRANYAGYVGLAQALALLSAIWVLCSLFTYVTAPQEMTVGDYKSGVLALQSSGLITTIAFALPAAATLVHLIFEPAQWGNELLCVLGYLASAALIMLIRLLEKKLTYYLRPSPDKKWAKGDAAV